MMKAMLSGEFRLTVRDKVTGEVLDRKSTKNVLETTFFPFFLNFVKGTGSGGALTQTNAYLHLNNRPSGAIQGAFSAPNHSSINTVSWTWRDSSNDVYTPTSVRVSRLGTQYVNTATTINWGTHNAGVTWDMEYILSIAGTGIEFTNMEGGSDYLGLHNMLRLLTGNLAVGYAFTAGNATLKTYDSLNNLSLTLPNANAVTLTASPDQLEWEFVSAPPGVTKYWDKIELGFWEGATFRTLRKSSSDGVASQTGAMQRTFKYQFRIT